MIGPPLTAMPAPDGILEVPAGAAPLTDTLARETTQLAE
jgi:hypothetical protein